MGFAAIFTAALSLLLAITEAKNVQREIPRVAGLRWGLDKTFTGKQLHFGNTIFPTPHLQLEARDGMALKT